MLQKIIPVINYVLLRFILLLVQFCRISYSVNVNKTKPSCTPFKL